MADERERRHSIEAGESEETKRTNRPVEQDGYVAAADETKAGNRTEEEDRAES